MLYPFQWLHKTRGFCVLKQVREVLHARYWLGETVPGTRSCHHFEASSTTLIKGKQLSDEHMHTIKDHSFSALPTAGEIASALKQNAYATYIFNGFWCLAIVDLINVEEKDVTCKFIYLDGSTNNIHWTCTDYMGYVSFNKFIMTAHHNSTIFKQW